MVTIDVFVGALLGEITKGRAISDQASVRLAEYYLNSELLKGFPVPRMQISTLEVDLQFAVAAKARESLLLEDEEVQKSIRYQMRDFLGSLPNHPAFHTYFRNDASLSVKWKGGLDDLSRRIGQVLTKPPTDCAAVIHKLSVSAQNYFCELAPDDLRLSVSSLLMRPLKRGKDKMSLRTIIEEQVRAIVAPLGGGNKETAPEAPVDLNILVGAAELEKLNPSLLNKMKITVSPSDRRWVVSEKDEKKVYILS